MENDRWILRNDLIWFKPNVPPRPERDRLRLAHEHFFHFVKRPTLGRAKYYYDLAAVEDSALDVVRCNVRPGARGTLRHVPGRPHCPAHIEFLPRGWLGAGSVLREVELP